MTASPAELVVMLFDNCMKDLRFAELASQEPRSVIKINEYMIKAQKIITELMSSLDMNYELSRQLLPLYDYCLRSIRHMNVKKDLSELPAIMQILTQQRDTWQQVAKTANAGEGRQACI